MVYLIIFIVIITCCKDDEIDKGANDWWKDEDKRVALCKRIGLTV